MCGTGTVWKSNCSGAKAKPVDPDEVVGDPADQVRSELVAGGDTEFADRRGLAAVEVILDIDVRGCVGIDPDGMGQDRAVGGDEIQIGTPRP